MWKVVALCLWVALPAAAQTLITIVPPGKLPEGYCDPGWPKLPGTGQSCIKEAAKPPPPPVAKPRPAPPKRRIEV